MKIVLLTLTCICFLQRIHSSEIQRSDACGDQGVCKCRATKSTVNVYCQNRSLTEVPSHIPNDTAILNLNDNRLSNISAEAFKTLTRLQQLTLRNNTLQTVPSGIFTSMHVLQSLDISYNSLGALPDGIFDDLTGLKYLRVSNNQLTHISANSLQSLGKLLLVDFSYNSLHDIPENIFHPLKAVKDIKIHANNITELPPRLFTPLPSLRRLFLHRNKLTLLPTSVFQSNAQLSRIYLAMNRLETIQPQLFQKLTKLAYLDLSNNSLQNVSREFFSKPSAISYIDLSLNDISILPGNFFSDMPNLRNFAITSNRLKEIPAKLFFSTPELQIINFSWNQLREIPDSLFQSATNLKRVNFLHNSLSEVPANLFNVSKKLTDIKFSYNPITTLPSGLFKSCTSLTNVIFQNNSLISLPDDFLQDSPNVVNLQLSINSLETFPKDMFSDKPTLQHLDFYSNELREIPADSFHNTSNLTFVQFHGNNLQTIPDNLFQFTPKIYYLDVSSNNLKHITRRTIHGIQRVASLSFANNSISQLPSDLLCEIDVLDKLDFSCNNISKIPAGLFNCNNRSYSLKLLFLHKNVITVIPRNAFAGLYLVQYIFLYDNKIHYLAEGSFKGTGVSSIYLFSNKLSRLDGNTFSNTNISEIHLYSNKIRNISKEAIMGLKNKTVIYLSCQNLAEAPWAPIPVTVKCASPVFVPTLTFQRTTLPYALRQQGFRCNISNRATSTCQPCRPGTFGDGINGCTACPPGGFYQDEIAQTSSYQGGMACKKCNNGTFVEREGGIAIDQCKVCPEGTNQSIEAGFRACICKKNYARTDRFGPCELCLDEGLNCTDHDFKALLPGYYWNWSFPSANLENYSMFVKNLKDESRFYDSHYSNYSGEIPKIYKCPRSKSCENKESQSWFGIAGSCSDGYTGWLCSKCKDGFFMVLNTCVRCPDKIWLILELAVIIGLCVIFYVLVIWQYKRDQRRMEKKRTIMDIIVSRGKIILGFYQVVGEFFESLHDVSWAGGLQVIGEIISYVELNVLRVLVRPQCYDKRLSFNPKVELIIGLSLPISITLVSACFYFVYKVYLLYKVRKRGVIKHHDKILEMKTKLTTLIMVLLFVMYPSICTVIFQLLPRACKTFCLDSPGYYCLHLLRSDYEINCESLSYYQYAAYCATVLYVVLYPCALFYLLRKHCSGKSVRSLRTGIQDDEARPDEQTLLLQTGSKKTSVPVWLNFLCENYKPQYWYWEILELTRKVTQTILIILLGWEDKLTMLLTIGISVLFLTLHARFWPMKDAFDQRLQMFSLTAIFINVVVAAMQVPENYEGAINIFLILLNVVVLLLIAGEILLVFVRHLRRLKRQRVRALIFRKCRRIVED